MLSLPGTRFRAIGRPTAILVAVALVVSILLLLQVAGRYSPPQGATQPNRGDLALYSRIVERMRGGEGYYEAAHAELAAGGYGTASIFNWRPPALAWLASQLPSNGWCDNILRVTAVAAVLFVAVEVLSSHGLATAVFVILALGANLVTAATPNSALFADVVAGVLILGSVAAYGRNAPLIGVALALAALLARELAALYVGACVLLALRENRRIELAAWMPGLAIAAIYFAWHIANVEALTGGSEGVAAGDWLRFGGVEFVLATAQFNGFLQIAPMWVTAVILPFAFLGLAAWEGDTGRRLLLSVAACVAAFTLVGKPANDYWGALYTPLMMMGAALAPAAAADLLHAIIEGRRETPDAPN